MYSLIIRNSDKKKKKKNFSFMKKGVNFPVAKPHLTLIKF